ncbi:MAG: polysaccharide biosynthesis/export family protein [Deltaproteobacteria bacterium]|jgi:polysaccharide export outer membrane protein|nr:polysaccharide biosynthesis/export family protein [Deltaproteobacteria bacterium]
MAWSARFLLILVLGALTLGAAACSKRSVQDTEVPPPATDDTTLGPGDVFTVRVYGEEELSGSHQVAPDGTIDFPLLGSVDVNGLEPPEVAARVRDLLKDRHLLRDPHVSVYVERYVSKRVSVVGAVANPGTFVLEPGMTVVEAISMAGGFSSLADRDGTVVTRRVGAETVRYRVPVAKVAKGQAKDIEVAAGDIIFVPERLF